MKTSILLFSFILSSLNLSAETRTFISPRSQVKLLELYTSESCSSCPPAEKWLNTFHKSKKLWNEVVPVEFHVDYWNYLHWNDRFSTAQFSNRQRKYHQVIKGGVYTPQMILNGKDWRAWRKRKIDKDLYTPGVLSAEFDSKSLKSNILFKKERGLQNKSFTCYAALLGGGFTTKVRSGENSGKALSHEFVVLDLQQAQMVNSTCSLKLNNIKVKKLKPDRQSIAFWVADSKTYQVIQATGGAL